MMKVMEGYIERKRLWKEVRNLMASQSPSVSSTQQELSQQQQQHHQPNYESEELSLTVKRRVVAIALMMILCVFVNLQYAE
jgi:hypothetical protein